MKTLNLLAIVALLSACEPSVTSNKPKPHITPGILGTPVPIPQGTKPPREPMGTPTAEQTTPF